MLAGLRAAMTPGARPRPRLVFAACRPPFPLDNGARIRTYHLLAGLAGLFDTTLVTFTHHPGSPDGACDHRALEARLEGVRVVTVDGAGPRKRASQLASLLGPQSWTLGRYHTRAFAATLADIVAANRPCLVHFDDAGVAL